MNLDIRRFSEIDERNAAVKKRSPESTTPITAAQIDFCGQAPRYQPDATRFVIGRPRRLR